MLRVAGRRGAAAICLFIAALESAFAAAPFWQPLCPQDGMCSGSGALVQDGRAVLGVTYSNGTRRTQWVSLDSFAATDAGFVCGMPLASSACVVGGAAGGAVVDANGNALYTFNPSGLDPLMFVLQHGENLTSIYFDKTVPPTLVVGLNTGGGGT